jgi:hypothetical protein
MPYLPPTHHETSKRDAPNETKVKEKENETIPDSNWNLAKSMTHHNQTKELTTWFLNDVDQMNHCWTEQNMAGEDTNVGGDDDVDDPDEMLWNVESEFNDKS